VAQGVERLLTRRRPLRSLKPVSWPNHITPLANTSASGRFAASSTRAGTAKCGRSKGPAKGSQSRHRGGWGGGASWQRRPDPRQVRPTATRWPRATPCASFLSFESDRLVGCQAPHSSVRASASRSRARLWLLSFVVLCPLSLRLPPHLDQRLQGKLVGLLRLRCKLPRATEHALQHVAGCGLPLHRTKLPVVERREERVDDGVGFSGAAGGTRRRRYVSGGGGTCDDPGVERRDEIAREAAAMLRRLLEAVDRGDITAGTPQAVAILRRIEGAAAALEALGRAQHPGDEPETPSS
jgi:hypothetical protein